MQIGFIGAGKMAEAIIAALVQTELCDPWEIMACDKSEARRDVMATTYQVAVTDNIAGTISTSDVLILAVKPQDLGDLLKTHKKRFTKQQLIISIAAGKTLAVLRKALGTQPRLIRVMPNLALMVQEGMSVYCAAKNATDEDKQLVTQIFGSAGSVLELSEKRFDAVTALSGSGPAFFAYYLKAMIDGTVALGMPADAARLLAEQTLIGTGIYLQNTGRNIEEFIQAVASPKGTTAAGLAVLAKSSVAKNIAKTLAAAATRSAELSKA